VIGRTVAQLVVGFIVVVMLQGRVCAADAGAAREYLDRARTTTQAIQLGGNQSAARRAVACALADLDARAALDLVGGVRRPSDAARALGAVAAALSASDPQTARESAAQAGRLLLRIADQERRAAEQRLVLSEVASLGQDALPAAPELSAEEAYLAVVLSLAESDPRLALALLRRWELASIAADEAAAQIAPALARKQPDEAVTLASQIARATLREDVLWRIAEELPPEEATGIAQRVGDPVVRSAMLESAAIRMAARDAEAALAAARQVSVAAVSALANLAAALANCDEPRALELARGLPARARRWALGQIAVELASARPARAEGLLAEIGPHADIVRAVASRMAASDPKRAVRVVREMLEGEAEAAALAAVAPELAKRDVEEASELVWQMPPSRWRSAAARWVALELAESDSDAATSVIGLVDERESAWRLRCQVAVVVARGDPESAARLLGGLPPSDYRKESALEAARAAAAARRSLAEVSRLGAIGMERDLALRWLVPAVARSEMGSALAVAEEIGDPYLRAQGLVDGARTLLQTESKCRPAPDRARQIRVIVEWEEAQ
jgi:hypothetical protein